MSSGVTVAICCHNSENEIVTTLQYLAKQEVAAEIAWEVLLVDNASSDQTIAIAEQTWRSLDEPVPLRILSEPKLGVTHARKTSILQANYPYILMVDDDVWISPNYVNDGYKIMQSNTNIGVLCGWGEPVLGVDDIPPWLTEDIRYSCTPKPAQEGESKKKAVIAMGSFIQKSIFVQLYEAGFNTIQESRKGDGMDGGEDLEMSLMVALLGYEIWESPRLYYKHYIPADRINKPHLEKMSIGNGKAVFHEVPYVWLLQKSTFSGIKNNVVYYALSASWHYLKHKLSRGYHNQLKATEYRVYLQTLFRAFHHVKGIQANLTEVKYEYERSSTSKYQS